MTCIPFENSHLTHSSFPCPEGKQAVNKKGERRLLLFNFVPRFLSESREMKPNLVTPCDAFRDTYRLVGWQFQRIAWNLRVGNIEGVADIYN